jgi:hypothetical protein
LTHQAGLAATDIARRCDTVPPLRTLRQQSFSATRHLPAVAVPLLAALAKGRRVADLQFMWNYRTSSALVFMSNDLMRAVKQVPLGSSSKSGTLDAQVGVPPATRAKWHERLQRGLLRIWLGLSVLWICCILAILGQCVYGPWIGWQQAQCDAASFNPVETYVAEIGTALGPPAAVLLLYRVVMWWSRRFRRSR